MQPGQTIAPGGSKQPPEESKPQDSTAGKEVSVDIPRSAEHAAAETGQQPSVVTPAAPNDEAATHPTTSTPEEPSTWQYNADYPQSGPPTSYGADQSVTWSASEYIAHHKDQSWFVGFGFVIAVLAIAIYLFTRSTFSPIMIVIMGVAFGVFAARQPQVLQYTVNRTGILVGEKLYPYANFKSFSVIEEGPMHSILLSPLQRFMPPLSVFYDPADEDKIMDIISDHLPFAEAPRDAVDSLMRRVRF